MADNRSSSPKKSRGGKNPLSNVIQGFYHKDEINKHYEIKEVLGRGAFSVVKRAVHKKTGEEYAVKIVLKKKAAEKKDMIETEIAIFKQVDHKNVIKLHELYESKERLFLVTELVTGGELFDQILEKGSYTEKEARKVARDMLRGISYLHSLGIVHRDLKPENLLFSDKSPKATLKVTDFGLSKIMVNQSTLLQTQCGTPAYVAPEVLFGEGYGPEVDLWGCGVIIFIILSGTTPFHADNNAELFEQIMNGDYCFHPSTWEGVSDQAKALVRKCLTVDPKERITAADALRDPWFSEDLRGRMTRLDTKNRLTQWNLKRKEDNEKERQANRQISMELNDEALES
uniref:non-specific serine/threonine protein kinase n=1 Tax=Paramoeba aestuarina TaxID=180227 RepID=A0A7S4KGT9_9EUKA|mmetsp:Transcript_19019/g.29819  ORF Transcript_19019/g.29819 Transcript_19019/m.29819 type:complete len:343 (+) Transcript_19019:125-1153(+)|eukprot:CAMPEP_0201525124 /NCGR_PEP_ID=MMETSP0161_2-20130828/26846_1 /ASSEMBLY_ACC=CAM_ASM_000251 /TAXON_ID=180227 /ORGANISM="Neoparamoeba aestuarina, Strain SoJaBio B1-5/56/2" /LENGTH=342 /DNA_ID=CAMNT_0047924903 /DNA_START=123 /DNA_END=1151 /DNA_ORIENTATION=+